MASALLSGSSPGAAEATAFRVLKTSQIRPGVVLRHAIHDESNVLLLAAGVTVTPLIRDRLIQRNIDQVLVHPGEWQRLTNRQPKFLEQSLPIPTTPSSLDRRPFVEQVKRPGTVYYSRETAREIVQHHDQSLVQMKDMFATVKVVRPSEFGAIQGLSVESLDEISRDIDLFVMLGIMPDPNDFPARHGLHTAMLAMSIGTNLGLDRANLVALGTGCMVHDIGLSRLRQDLIRNDKPLTQAAYLELSKHPGITYDMLQQVDGHAGLARLIAYQVHERCNGTGYPRRRERNQIHPLSRIAAVADTYTALISPRSYRPPHLPYDAVKELLKGVQNGLFDTTAVRGLLQTVSLFPLGSFVELCDGRVGRVVRSNVIEYARPIVEIGGVLVDLSQNNDAQIVRAIPPTA